MWKLIEQDGLKYFRFEDKEGVFLQSTRHGEEIFLEKFSPRFLKQVHSDIIIDIDAVTAGATDKAIREFGDGLLTGTRQAIGVKVADCLSVYLLSQERACILHCGWRSIIKGIAEKAKLSMGNYRYCFGACIGPCCYDIGKDVVEQFTKKYPQAVKYRNKKYFLDLKKAVAAELGVQCLVGSLDYCTKCNPDHFYSYRRGDKQRNYAVVMRK